MSAEQQLKDNKNVVGRIAETIRRLQRIAFFSSALIYFEALWPHIVSLISIIGLFLIYALSGIAIHLNSIGRSVLLLLFGALFLKTVYDFFLTKRSDRKSVIRRIDADSQSTHRAAQTLLDRQSLSSAVQANELWIKTLYLKSLALGGISLSLSKSKLPQRDPFAIRFQIWILVIAVGFIQNGNLKSNIISTLSFDRAGYSAGDVLIEGWISPPPYTGIPPIMISIKDASQGDATQFSAPIHSQLLIKNYDKGLVIRESNNSTQLSNNGDQSHSGSFKLDLNSNSNFQIQKSGSDIAKLDIKIIPDLPPSIELIKIESLDQEHVKISYKIDDDYPVKQAELRIVSSKTRNLTSRENEAGLIPAPVFDLPIPAEDLNQVKELVIDSSTLNAAWAGAEIVAILAVKDQVGQESRSEEFSSALPSRLIQNDLARSLVELSQTLLRETDLRQDVVEDLEVILSNQNLFKIRFGTYVGLRSVLKRIRESQDHKSLLEAGLDLDQLALAIEVSDKDLFRTELQSVLDKLKADLGRGHNSADSQKLIDQFKDALKQIIQELESNTRSGEGPNGSGQITEDDKKTLNDLLSLLEKLDEYQKNGKSSEANQLLDQLKKILEGLKAANPAIKNSESDEFSALLDDLDRMTRMQQELRDETFREGKGRQEGRKQNSGPTQKLLTEELQKFMRQLESLGVPKLDSLEKALEAMRSAENSSEAENDRELLDDQGRALKGLRQGKQDLNDLAQGAGGEGSKRTSANGQNGKANSSRSTNRDPQGHTRESLNESGDDMINRDNKSNDARMRSEEVLKEIGRKLGEKGRSTSERDYFQRLLELN